MSTFTIRVRDLVDLGFDFGLKPEHYPIFDENYRSKLNDKILNHYMNYEIGQETDSMFRFSLNRKMSEIMPYYNQLYKSCQIEFDPLETINFSDITNSTDTRSNIEEIEGSSTESSNGTSNSSTNGKSRSVSSITPQVQLSGDEDYASNAADVNSVTDVEGNTTGTSTGNNSTNATLNQSSSATIERNLKGRQQNASDLLMNYRNTFLNIDMQIIKELESLFMQIWDTGDSFSNSNTMNWSYGYGFGIF